MQSEILREFEEKFSGVLEIYGARATQILLKKKVAVIGLGGVGSWAAEALARSGVHNLILMDMDDICISNTNRQIHTHTKTYGKLKTHALSERLKLINPECCVHSIDNFYTESTQDLLWKSSPDFVIDCIDSVKSKCHLISECKKRNIPLIVTGGAGGRVDPTKIVLTDLNLSKNDKLLMQVRKKLKREFAFPRYQGKKFHIPCLNSTELITHKPASFTIDNQAISRRKFNCQNGLGAAVFVTATFGFYAAGHVINTLLKGEN